MSSKRILVLFLIFAVATAALFMSCANPSSGPSEYEQKKQKLMTEIYRDTVGTVDKRSTGKTYTITFTITIKYIRPQNRFIEFTYDMPEGFVRDDTKCALDKEVMVFNDTRTFSTYEEGNAFIDQAEARLEVYKSSVTNSIRPL